MKKLISIITLSFFLFANIWNINVFAENESLNNTWSLIETNTWGILNDLTWSLFETWWIVLENTSSWISQTWWLFESFETNSLMKTSSLLEENQEMSLMSVQSASSTEVYVNINTLPWYNMYIDSYPTNYITIWISLNTVWDWYFYYFNWLTYNKIDTNFFAMHNCWTIWWDSDWILCEGYGWWWISNVDIYYKPLTPILSCWTNARTFYSSETSYDWTFCTNWSSWWFSWQFPAKWQTVNWTCYSNTTWETKNCSASRNISTLRDWLVWEWNLDWNANDTSWNWNHWTPYNVEWVDSGRGDGKKVAKFNSNWKIILPSNIINNFNEITVTAFAKRLWPANWSDWKIIDIRDWGASPIATILLNNSPEQTNIYAWFWNVWYVVLDTPFNNNEWIFYALKSKDWVASFYINNQLVWTMSSWNNSKTSLAAMIWQEWNDGAPRFFNWMIWPIKIYNRALSESEVQQLYQQWSQTTPPINNTTPTNQPTYVYNPVILQQNILYALTDTSTTTSKTNSNLKQTNTTTKDANTHTAWDPVNLATWEFDYENTFLSIPWKKLPYEFKLTYKNQTYYNWPAWINWDHNYNKFISEEENWNILYYNWKLWVFRFIKNEDWTFQYNLWLKAILSKTQDWTYLLTYDSKDKEYFNTDNKLSKLQDKYWNNLTFSYNSDKLLQEVTDTLWRKINYTYENNRLKEVTDFNSNKVELSYFDSNWTTWNLYDLKEVTINNSWNTKTIKFEYTTWWDDNSNHNLTKLIDSKNQTYVTNTYEDDRVKTQIYWDWTITYNYTLWENNNIIKNTVTDKVWNVVEYFYNENWSNTKTIYHWNNKTYTYEYIYNSDWYLTKETKPAWNWIKYSYDNKWNIIEKRQKTDINAQDNTSDIITTYTYNSENKPLTITNPNWNIITNTYDTNWNLTQTLTKTTDINQVETENITKYSYDTAWNLTKVIYPNQNQKVLTYSWWLLVKTVEWTWTLLLTNTFTYDKFWNIIKQVDQNSWTTTLTYDEFNALINVKNPIWTENKTSYDKNNNKILEETVISSTTTKQTKYEYDILDNITKKIEETSSWTYLETANIYDANWNLLQTKTWNNARVFFTYNNFAKVTEKTIKQDENDSNKDIKTTYSYDDNWNLVQITDPLWNITNYEYDLFDRIIKTINAKWVETIYSYDKNWNIIKKETKNNAWNILQSQEITYDELWREIKTKTLKENNTFLETSKIYDINWKVKSFTDALWKTTNYEYDILSRLTKETDPLWNITNYKYDKNWNITETNNQNWSNIYNIKRYTYDRANRLTKEEQISTNTWSLTTSYSYDKFNNITRITDGNGKFVSYSYDYMWNNTAKTEYLSWNTNWLTTRYTYDINWNLTSIKDPKNQTTTYEYDNLWRLTKTTYSNWKFINYTYDKNNNLLSQTDPNWTTTTNTYDELWRLTSRNIQTWSGVLWVTSETYTYDDLWRILEANDSNNHKLEFSYDKLWRLITETQSWSNIGYTFNNNWNLTSITVPHPSPLPEVEGTINQTTYEYDDIWRLENIKKNNEVIRNYSYEGLLNDEILNWNNTKITKTYDEFTRLEWVQTTNISNNDILKTYTYTYDKAWNITNDNNKEFIYDETYRLTQVKQKNNEKILESYNYDKAGNRINDLDENYIVNNLNQYTNVSNPKTLKWKNFIYDDNGNLRQDTKNTYEYDYKNRLIRVKNESWIIVEYKYDVLWRRYEKKTDDYKINYIYSNENIIEEIKTQTIWWEEKVSKKEYINWLWTDELIAVEQEESSLWIAEREELSFCEEIVLNQTWSFVKYWWNAIVTRCNELKWLPQEIVFNRYYFANNHLWSVVWITDNSWSLVSEYNYDSYWNFTLSWSDIWNDRLFTGREYDEEVKLYYFRARYYDSEIGRFISRDPIGQVDDVNLYSYVGNNPVMFVDPSWLKAKDFIEKHDATELLKKYMNDSQEELSYFWLLPRIDSPIKYPFGSLNKNKWNIKHNEDFISLSYNPERNNESCKWYKNWAWVCEVFINWEKMKLDQIWNFLIWYNWYYAWFTLNNENWNHFTDIYKAWMYIEQNWVDWAGAMNYENALKDELEDRPFYDKWYYHAKNEEKEKLNLINNFLFGK